MNKNPDFDAFDEFKRKDEEMKALQEELRQLGSQGQHEEAIRRAEEEMRPLHKEWYQSLIKFLMSFKK